MADPKHKFAKPALSLDAQVELLASRGMGIPDPERAKHYLRFIGYYRLSGYFRFFADGSDAKRERFREGTNFDDVLALYIFDRKMRVLLMDAFERIEIAVKAVISHEGALAKGPFWLSDSENFGYGLHRAILDDIKDSVGERGDKAQHLFIYHFYKKYSDEMPPCWMLVEATSFGLTSRIFKASKGDIQVLIANKFGLHRTILESWLHVLAFGRNVCAHNCRVWNRTFTIKPKIPNKYGADWPVASHDKLYVLCCIIHCMMGAIVDETAWSERLRALVNERGDLPIEAMGFPTDWEAKPFWAFKPEL